MRRFDVDERADARAEAQWAKHIDDVTCEHGHVWQAILVPAVREGDFAGPEFWSPDECPVCQSGIVDLA